MSELVCSRRALMRRFAMSLKHREKPLRTDVIRRRVDGDIMTINYIHTTYPNWLCREVAFPIVFVCHCRQQSLVRMKKNAIRTRRHVTWITVTEGAMMIDRTHLQRYNPRNSAKRLHVHLHLPSSPPILNRQADQQRLRRTVTARVVSSQSRQYAHPHPRILYTTIAARAKSSSLDFDCLRRGYGKEGR